MHTPPDVHAPSVHSIWCSTLQPPGSAQHEPICAQGFGLQTPSWVHVLFTSHAAKMTVVHTPASEQQDPVPGQGLGSHAIPSPQFAPPVHAL
jgi:hypothetical protein